MLVSTQTTPAAPSPVVAMPGKGKVAASLLIQSGSMFVRGGRYRGPNGLGFRIAYADYYSTMPRARRKPRDAGRESARAHPATAPKVIGRRGARPKFPTR